jgi:hypothetical protein
MADITQIISTIGIWLPILWAIMYHIVLYLRNEDTEREIMHQMTLKIDEKLDTMRVEGRAESAELQQLLSNL